MSFKSLQDGLMIILITCLAMLAIVYWVEYTSAVEMSASVQETEINHCVEVLDKAGWINNHITVQF